MNDETRLVSELLGDIYENSSGSKISVIKITNDVLMTSKEIAKMFGVGIPAINKKLKKIFNSGEFNKKQVSSILTHKANDDKLYRTTCYNLQVIVRIGTMLKSAEVNVFQRWLDSKENQLLNQMEKL